MSGLWAHDRADGTRWLSLHFGDQLSESAVEGLLRQWALDHRAPVLTLEARACRGRVRYLIGSNPATAADLPRQLGEDLVGVAVVDGADRRPVEAAGQLRGSTRLRPLRVDNPVSVSRAILGGLTAAIGKDEELVLQLQLGPRRMPMVVPTDTPRSSHQGLWQAVTRGAGGNIDGKTRSALRAKVSQPGFACAIRLGVVAGSSSRRRALMHSLLAGVRSATGVGSQFRFRRCNSVSLSEARSPLFWPLRLSTHELLGLLAWPIGKEPLPGQPPVHPRRLRPDAGVVKRGRSIAISNAPGTAGFPLAMSVNDSLRHLHVLGPTGTGKSTLLAGLIIQDLQAGRGCLVVDPKGDLVSDVLSRVPVERVDDVVVLDPADVTAPVGLNPLATVSNNPAARQLAADSVLAVFHQLYADSWGPRTQDILHASLLTLARRSDASLIMLPLLLTNPGFRRSMTGSINDPIALGPFWAWYENLSDGERAQAIAPVMNKLRAVLMRPAMRAVLGQVRPKFNIRQVFTEGKILLVSLAKGTVGQEASALLGSLVVAQAWQATLERAAVPAAQRRPVMIYVDEVQEYLHLPTDLADGLAQARGLGVGFTLAHQFLGQLTPTMRAALLSNVRSTVCFGLSTDDALVMARGAERLEAEDFTTLGSFEIYAQLLSRGNPGGWVSGRTLPLPETCNNPRAIRAASRLRWGRPLDEIERGFAELVDGPDDGSQSFGRRPRRSS